MCQASLNAYFQTERVRYFAGMYRSSCTRSPQRSLISIKVCEWRTSSCSERQKESGDNAVKEDVWERAKSSWFVTHIPPSVFNTHTQAHILHPSTGKKSRLSATQSTLWCDEMHRLCWCRKGTGKMHWLAQVCSTLKTNKRTFFFCFFYVFPPLTHLFHQRRVLVSNERASLVVQIDPNLEN